MSPETRTLFWKEWRERKSQLAVYTAWMLCAAIYVVGYELAHRFRAPVAGFYSVAGTYGLIAAVFLAMRTAVGETTQKTIGFTAALPVFLRRIAWARLGGAAVTLAGPIVLAAVVVSVTLATGLIEQA